MNSPTSGSRILHLGSDAGDAAQLDAELEAAAIACRVAHVSTEAGLTTLLEAGDIALVIADLPLPWPQASSRLAELQRARPRLPILFRLGSSGNRSVANSADPTALAVRKALSDREAEPSAGLGQLVERLAHDLINLLTVIVGNAQLGLQRTAHGSSEREGLEQIVQAAEDATGRIRNLLAQARREPRAELRAARSGLPGHTGGSALLVEQDSSLRRALTQQLSEQGIEVLEASGPVEALEWLARGSRFDAVVTGYVLPKMDGVRLIRHLRDFRPQLPAVLIADATVCGSAEWRGLQKTGATEILNEPLTPGRLADSLARVRSG